MNKRCPVMGLGAALLPWTEDFTLDEALFRRSLRIMIAGGLTHICIFDTAGEGLAINSEEFDHVTRSFIDELAGTGVTPVTGCISLSAAQTVSRLKTAYELGARDFQISFPSWEALTDGEVDVFFHQVCDPFPDCNFMHCNNSGRSKKPLRAKDYMRLAEEIPNLVSVKFMNDSLEDVINAVKADCPIQFILSEYGYGYGCMFGECSMLFSSITTHLSTAWRLFRAGQERDIATIVEIEKEVAVSQEILFETCTTPVINAAYDKLYIKSVIPEFPMRLYPPYQTLPEEQVENYFSQMRARLPQWFE